MTATLRTGPRDKVPPGSVDGGRPAGPPGAEGPGPKGLLAAAGWALVLAAVAVALAPTGSLVIYGLLAAMAAAAIARALRADLAPAWTAAVDRVRPSRFARSSGTVHRPGRIAGIATVVLVVAAFATLGSRGGTGSLLVLAAAGLLAAGIWLLWPLLHDLVTAPPTDLPPRNTGGRHGHAAAPVARSVLVRIADLIAVLLVASGLAWLAAQLGIQGAVVAIGLLALAAALGLVPDRSVFLTFAGVASLTFVLHKSLTAQDLEHSGGAISIYISTFDMVLVVLYAVWIAEGTFLADVRPAFRRPIMWVPLLGAAFLLPGVLRAPSLLLATGELVRMGWMYLLFLYIAVRVRTLRHVYAVLGGLAVFALIELVVVVLQARTGGVLGLSFLGVPTELGERTTDSDVIGRPFGTIIHPVFMGAALGVVATLALALAVELPRSLVKFSAVALFVVCVIPMFISQTRASLVALAVAAVVVVGAGLVRGRIQVRTVAGILGAAALLALLATPYLLTWVDRNFGTGHYFEEVSSRTQLNDIAMRIIGDHWVLGIGLNNFETVLPAYQPFDVIFAGNPVHNLYLLYLAETGFVGFLGVAVVGGAMALVALRAARVDEPLLSGTGVGVAGAMLFLAIEELLGFSLRQDIPLALYWLLAGLAVAGTRIAGPLPAGRSKHRWAAAHRAHELPGYARVAATNGLPTRAPAADPDPSGSAVRRQLPTTPGRAG